MYPKLVKKFTLLYGIKELPGLLYHKQLLLPVHRGSTSVLMNDICKTIF